MSAATKKVCILYGFAEGPKVARRLIRVIESHGHQIVSDPEHADITIAHSGGCFIAPTESSGKVVAMVGPCYHFKGTFFRVATAKVIHDFFWMKGNREYGFWAYKLFWNGFYMFTRPVYTAHMAIESFRDGKDVPDIEAAQVHIISYGHDPWSKRAEKLRHLHPHYIWDRRAGSHDDIWYRPEAYAHLLS